jgi:hypothetical protein
VFYTPRGQTLLLPPPVKANGKPAADDVATLVSRMWHFPTVAVRKYPATDLQNFLAESLGTKNGMLHLEPMPKVRHAVTYRNVTVLPFRIVVEKIPSVRGAKNIRLEDFSALPVSNLTRKIARAALSKSLAAAAKD